VSSITGTLDGVHTHFPKPPNSDRRLSGGAVRTKVPSAPFLYVKYKRKKKVHTLDRLDHWLITELSPWSTLIAPNQGINLYFKASANHYLEHRRINWMKRLVSPNVTTTAGCRGPLPYRPSLFSCLSSVMIVKGRHRTIRTIWARYCTTSH